MTVPAPTRLPRGPQLAVLGGRSPAPAPAPLSLSTHVRVDSKLATATHEVLVISTMSDVLGDPTAMFRQVDRHNLHRGVRYRVLFPDRARTNPAVAKRLNRLTVAGAEVRTMPEVPVNALVIDGKVAVLPSEPEDGRPAGVAMFRLPSVVRTIVELFDQVWPAAVALSACRTPDGTELTEREKELLSLLSAGCTDESVGAQLGISVRTVRRMVSGIMNRLGARSRFQAGAKAADRGWLMERVN
ncbi:helix-turn-helix transcriptional regulator [Amycolatopsis antarctica]|uniref:Helix-turn-helix transcriptional regulator n=1 Tax=Amycolatopsis antarctica TaxID=1854586 RepID=A0A263CYS0_9PSEU|nr:LuxR C-terminal-related transcriptional regulator [Amycolatopsis antarctica]OZM71320.1 helix-turn-helix transcriptional regulator [Amycolatopsis antarctica]